MHPRPALRTACALCLATALAANVKGQTLPETVWVPVIYYDYHANFANPDFQSPYYSADREGLRTGMVKPLLDPDSRKPVLAADKVFNAHLNDWYKPSGGTGATFEWRQEMWNWKWLWTGLVQYRNRPGEWVGKNFSETDSMASIVIYDSLPFLLIDQATQTYQFADSAFFPLDGRGFGAGPDSNPAYGFHNTEKHNYGFAMELHSEFTLKPGLEFTFTSADDAWTFINGRLAMDLGGIHGAVTDSFSMDSIAAAMGMMPGKTCPFDFFYAQRHLTRPSIKITMVFSGNCALVTMRLTMASTIRAGVVQAVAKAWADDCEGREDMDMTDAVRWEIAPSTKQPGDSIYTLRGDTLRLSATKAWRSVTYLATLTDPGNGMARSVTGKVFIEPGAPARVSIERLPGSAVFDTTYYNVSNPIDTMVLLQGSKGVAAYALVRDKFGNFVDFARRARWTMIKPEQGNAIADTDARWSGLIMRSPSYRTTETGYAYVVVTQDTLAPDTVVIAMPPNTAVSLPAITHLPGIEVRRSRHGLLVRGMGDAYRDASVKVLSLDGRTVFDASPGASDNWAVRWNFRGAGAEPVRAGTYLLKVRTATASRCSRIVIGR